MPAPRNLRPTLIVIGERGLELPYRGVMYELRPVSFPDGLRLLEARNAIEEAGAGSDAASVKAIGSALRTVVGMTRRYLRPRGRLRGLRWRLRLSRNPFRRATESEVGEILGFFLASRMMSRARLGT